MDEATAALDEITAKSIMNSVLAMEDITEIIVTHRLEESVMRKYDEIIVLHHGEVAESGTFEELMERCGLFYFLYLRDMRNGFSHKNCTEYDTIKTG